ncbi:MAG: hypothetical protein ACRCVI_02580 [Mycoplasmoidaceae bacterium]
MNRKIKMSLLSTLFIGMSVAVVLPIVSCSSSSTGLNIDKQVNNQTLINEFGTALAKVGKPSVTNNSSTLSEAEFNNITKDYTSSDTDVWAKAKAFFKATDDAGKDVFDDAISVIKVIGTYPGAVANSRINVQIKLETKNGYSASQQDLSYTPVQIGISPSVSLNIGTKASEINKVGSELAKLANTSATNNTGIITEAQFNTIINKNYDISAQVNLYNALNGYLIITRPNNSSIALVAVAESFRITGTYPVAGDASDVNVTLTIKLKSGYEVTNANLLIHTFKIGTSRQTLRVAQGSATNLTAVGVQLAKIANQALTSNTSIISSAQYDTIRSTSYSQSTHGDLWNALNGYFTFTKIGSGQTVSFTTATKSIIVSGVGYPTKADDPVKVKINVTLKDEYLTNDTDKLEIAEVQVGLAQETLVFQRINNSTIENNLALKFAQSLNSSVTDLNGIINRDQHAAIRTNDYSFAASPEIWSDLGQLITFSNPVSGNIGFNTVVSHLEVRGGSYPINVDSNVEITVKPVLKENYTLQGGSALPTFNLKIGKSQTIAKVEKIENNLNNVITRFLAVAGLTNNSDDITIENFDTIKNATYSETTNPLVWSAIVAYYAFTYNVHGESNLNQPVTFNKVVESIAVTGTYPEAPKVDATITFTLNTFNNIEINDPTLLTQTIKLGTSPKQDVVISVNSDEAIKTNLGWKLAQTINPEFTNNQANLSSEQFSIFKDQSYTKNNSEIWAALKANFTITPTATFTDFDDVILKADVITANYDFDNYDSPLSITLRLVVDESKYVSGSTSVLEDTIIVGKSLQITNLVPAYNETNKVTVATKIAQYADQTKFTTNDQPMTEAEYQAIVTNYNAAPEANKNLFKESLKTYLSFNGFEFEAVVSGITFATITYPTTPDTDLEIALTVNFSYPYQYENAKTMTINFIVGKTINPV